jgi:hypothetical protein
VCIRGRDDLMRDTEGDCSREGSRRSPRLSNPVEQTGIMGKGRAVRRDDRPALSATPDYEYFICNPLQIFQAEFSLGVRESLVKPCAGVPVRVVNRGLGVVLGF